MIDAEYGFFGGNFKKYSTIERQGDHNDFFKDVIEKSHMGYCQCGGCQLVFLDRIIMVYCKRFVVDG